MTAMASQWNDAQGRCMKEQNYALSLPPGTPYFSRHVWSYGDELLQEHINCTYTLVRRSHRENFPRAIPSRWRSCLPCIDRSAMSAHTCRHLSAGDMQLGRFAITSPDTACIPRGPHWPVSRLMII